MKKMSDISRKILNQSPEERMQERLDICIKSLCDFIDICPQEAENSINKYRKIFNNGVLIDCLDETENLCQWIISKKLKNGYDEEYRYLCFKCHLAGDWIKCDIYQTICMFADDIFMKNKRSLNQKK